MQLCNLKSGPGQNVLKEHFCETQDSHSEKAMLEGMKVNSSAMSLGMPRNYLDFLFKI